jgi:hypothetical protein
MIHDDNSTGVAYNIQQTSATANYDGVTGCQHDGTRTHTITTKPKQKQPLTKSHCYTMTSDSSAQDDAEDNATLQDDEHNKHHYNKDPYNQQ